MPNQSNIMELSRDSAMQLDASIGTDRWGKSPCLNCDASDPEVNFLSLNELRVSDTLSRLNGHVQISRTTPESESLSERYEQYSKEAHEMVIDAYVERVIPRVKMVITDMDGTFLSKKSTICMNNAMAFRQLNQKFWMAAATGRSRNGCLEALGSAAKQMGFEHAYPGVYLNGLVVYGCQGELLKNATHSTEQLQRLLTEILAIQAELSETLFESVTCYTIDNIYCWKHNYLTVMSNRTHGEPCPESLSESLPQDKTEMPSPYSKEERETAMKGLMGLRVNKLIISAAVPVIDILRPIFRERLGGEFAIVSGSSCFLEFLPPGQSKGKGVSVLVEHLNRDKNASISRQDIIALGDADNDIDMLRYVGTSIAMQNATQQVKEASMFIGSHHARCGVTDIIRRLKLLS